MNPMKLANAVMFVLFVSWAYFQFNDPDVLAWILLYSAAALCCLLYLLGRLPALLPLLVGAVALAWALLLLPTALGRDLGMFLDEEVGEPWREFFGLFIVAAWSAFLGWRLRGRVRTAPRPAAGR